MYVICKRLSGKPAPEGRGHKAWGFSPRKVESKASEAPKGRRQFESDRCLPAPLRGSMILGGFPYLGLKPTLLYTSHAPGLGSVGAEACSLGREPQGAGGQYSPRAP